MRFVPPLATTCADCPAHNAPHLIRLGVSMENYDYVVAMAGNPNTEKSTVFNALTGLRQHTGNWPGKTVARAEGGFANNGRLFKLVDLPGTYSLLSASYDEEIARDFRLFGRPDVTVIVADANCLERNLNLVLQVLEITSRVVVCLNLIDEAQRRGLSVNADLLAEELGVPVVVTSAPYGTGLDQLRQAITDVATGQVVSRGYRLDPQSPILARAVGQLAEQIRSSFPGLPNSQWVALQLLDGDERITEAVRSGELGVVYQHDSLHGEQRLHREPETAGESHAGAQAKIVSSAAALRRELGQNFHQSLMESLFADAARICGRTVKRGSNPPGP